MNAACAHHPDRLAQGACPECGKPICVQCRTFVERRPLCPACARAGGVAPPPDVKGDEMILHYSGAYQPPTSHIPVVNTVRRTCGGYGWLFAGLAAGLGAGVIAAWLWSLVSGYSSSRPEWLIVVVGWASGGAFALASQRRGVVPALLAGACALAFVTLAQYLYVADLLNKAALGYAATGTGSVAVGPGSFGQFLLDQWSSASGIYMAIGILGAVGVGSHGSAEQPVEEPRKRHREDRDAA